MTKTRHVGWVARTRRVAPIAGASERLASPRITIVVPTRNEAGNVEALEHQLSVAMGTIEYEVVVVDDSTDTVTRPILQATARRNPRWRVFERGPAERTGLASAVVLGIEAARGAAVCVMDGDLQHPPQIVPRLLSEAEAGADLAVASRYMKGGSRAGLDGVVRNLVSRCCTWLAQAIFPEARRTSDPLTGFFCCRRALVAGLELKPRGFKILLEILVCAPRFRVADVPFVFGSRLAGESKASTRQGVLFLAHLLSLFVYVPRSARPLKFALVTLIGLGAFSTTLWTLLHLGAPGLLAWIPAATLSAACTVGMHQLVAFRDVARHGEPDGDRLHYTAAAVSALTSFGVFTLLLVPGPHRILLAAVVAQACGVALMLCVNHPAVWKRLARMSPLLPMLDIQALARRLGAEMAFWLTTEPNATHPELASTGGLVTREMIAAASRHRQPALFVERRSARLQARVNIDSASAIVVPRMTESGEVSAVAVFVRRGRSPFEPRHLDEAITWVSSPNRWTGMPATAEVGA